MAAAAARPSARLESTQVSKVDGGRGSDAACCQRHAASRDKMSDERLDFPATRRNREPIAAVLKRWLADARLVLEVASGSGQHAVYMAAQLPQLRWQPSDPDPRHLASIERWRRDLRLKARVLAPVKLDVHAKPWPLPEAAGAYDAIFCANMIHIAPYSAALALLAGAGADGGAGVAALRPGGALCLYGPFHRGGVPTSESNARFDADLRARDARWGVRDLDDITRAAAEAGLALDEVAEMPANNLMVRFARG
jgi:SAM-dependent methyltransferase